MSSESDLNLSDSDTSSSESNTSSSDTDISVYSSSDSSDELELPQDSQKRKNENYVEQTVPLYDNKQFFEHFRVSRYIAENIAEQFTSSNYHTYHCGGNGKLSAIKHVLIYLWFVGHQTASFRDVADRFNITISCLFTVIRRMTFFLSNLSEKVITWPDANERKIIEQEFRENGFPGVIGAIDGCHIRIDKPEEDPDSYINRKSYYSIQMQAVCDRQLKIRDVFIGFPGSVHDSRVFRASTLSEKLPEICGGFYILGDSGYPCVPHLLTPFKDFGQLEQNQRNYNIQLAKNRYVIEHCFGVLKQKFRQLYHVKLRNIRDIVHSIRSCCVLHNIALVDEFNMEELAPQNEENVEVIDDYVHNDREGHEMRMFVANNLLRR